MWMKRAVSNEYTDDDDYKTVKNGWGLVTDNQRRFRQQEKLQMAIKTIRLEISLAVKLNRFPQQLSYKFLALEF